MGTTADKLQAFINGKQKIVDSTNAKANSSHTITTKWSEIAESIYSIETGIDTNDATATENDILFEKTAYARDKKLVGTILTYDGSNSEIYTPFGTIEITENGKYNVLNYDYAIINVKNGANPDVPTESKEFTPTKEIQEYTPVDVYVNYIKVNAIPDEYIIPEGIIDITNTEEVDVTQYAKAQIKDENLKPENIAENQTVLGIKGTHRGGVDTSDGTITADKVLKDEVGYAKEERIVGTIETYDYSASEEVKPEIDKFITGELTEIYNDRVTTLSQYAMRPISTSVVKLSFPNVVKCNTSMYSCAKAEEIYLPKATTIGAQEFQGCTKLYVVEIPNVTRLEMNTFNGCKALEKLEFNNLTYIANSAFTNCTAFKTLILRSDSVCQLAGTAPFLKDTLIASGNGYVYVKDELVEQYKVATNWSEIASQIKPLSEYVEEVE